jgi:hypothetical protein
MHVNNGGVVGQACLNNVQCRGCRGLFKSCRWIYNAVLQLKEVFYAQTEGAVVTWQENG